LQDRVDVGRIERLLEERRSAGHARALHQLQVRRRGRDHHAELGILPLDFPQGLHAVETRHVVVKEHQVEHAVRELLVCDGLLKPESLRTNCSAEARISSSVAGGSKLNNVRMLRHIAGLQER
jgi:hypothetical protein